MSLPVCCLLICNRTASLRTCSLGQENNGEPRIDIGGFDQERRTCNFQGGGRSEND